MRDPRPFLCLLLVVSATGLGQTAAPTPAEHLGFEPGTDRKLADYNQVWAYFEKLAATTGRVKFSSIGRTTEGHEMGFAVISSEKNLENLEGIRQTNLALVDPRRLKPGEAEPLIARGKTIVCLNASIHSVEVGPTQATLPLAHFLATTQDPEWLKVLDDVVLLMLPCHNPDGYLKQVDWYRKWVGTPYEGCPLPGLYHTYAGHDNNRDWFMFNLQETRLTVKEVYLRWVPQIVIDSHQMQEDGPRMFIPPYQDPIEPNVDPILIERLNELGLTVQRGLLAKGLTGIVNRTLFDAWSPSRAYMHYHGGVRFLCEIASCRQATPIERKGLDRRATTRPDLNPVPWKGERWALADIVRYHNETAMAVLRHASRNRDQWLRSFHQVFRKACASTDGPAAFVIPLEHEHNLKVFDILALAGLEGGQPDDQRIEHRKAVVVPRNQPFFSFARALLGRAEYPEIRDDGGALQRPYDTTAHQLPLLLGLRVIASDARVFTVNEGRACEVLPRCPPGTLQPLPQVGVYRSFVTNVMDEGWTRFVLNEYFCCEPRSLDNAAIAALEAGSGLRVLILPSMTADMIRNGNQGDEFPPIYRGGIGERGSAAIVAFVRAGGTVIALKDATALPIQDFRMPVRNALSKLPEGRRVNVHGAFLACNIDEKHAFAAAGGRLVPAVFNEGKAFEPDSSPDRDQTLAPRVVGRWAPAESLQLAGYAQDLDLLAGKGAIIQCRIGRGQVILFGFSPQFRGQTWATFPLLWAAIESGLERN